MTPRGRPATANMRRAAKLFGKPKVCPEAIGFKCNTCPCGIEFFPASYEPTACAKLCSTCRAERAEQLADLATWQRKIGEAA